MLREKKNYKPNSFQIEKKKKLVIKSCLPSLPTIKSNIRIRPPTQLVNFYFGASVTLRMSSHF